MVEGLVKVKKSIRFAKSRAGKWQGCNDRNNHQMLQGELNGPLLSSFSPNLFIAAHSHFHTLISQTRC